MPRRASTATICSRQALLRLISRCVAHSRLICIISSGSVVAMPRGQPRPLSQQAQRTQPRATISAVPITTPSAPRAMAFKHVVGRADAARGDQRDLVANALGHQELVHLGDGVLDGHGDVLLGDVGRRAGAAVAAVQVDDVRPGVVAAHRHHVHVGGRGDLHAHQAVRVHLLDPVQVLLVVLHAVDAVEGEGLNRALPATASRMRATGGVFLSPSRWPPRPGLAPCAYLNSTMRTRWMVSSRTPNRPVATWVITWSS